MNGAAQRPAAAGVLPHLRRRMRFMLFGRLTVACALALALCGGAFRKKLYSW